MRVSGCRLQPKGRMVGRGQMHCSWVEPEGKVCLGQREVGNVHLKGRFLGAGKLADNQSDAAKG